jgi:hypothetical protein
MGNNYHISRLERRRIGTVRGIPAAVGIEINRRSRDQEVRGIKGRALSRYVQGADPYAVKGTGDSFNGARAKIVAFFPRRRVFNVR